MRSTVRVLIWLMTTSLCAFSPPVFGQGPPQPPDNQPREAAMMARMRGFTSARPTPGQLAPDFELRDLKGVKVSLAELLKTKPVVLEFGSFT